jgi:hypothetical protein
MKCEVIMSGISVTVYQDDMPEPVLKELWHHRTADQLPVDVWAKVLGILMYLGRLAYTILIWY